MNELVKDHLLRLHGDQGAETLARYLAQMAYTAYWCIRMIRTDERIDAVIPEGLEDMALVRGNRCEFHQVKTRDESQGPWSMADVLPSLCKQYHLRNTFPGQCEFHFVSNQIADNKRKGGTRSLGSLYRLKFLLDIQHEGQTLSDDEAAEMAELEGVLVPRIRSEMLTAHDDAIDEPTALDLVRRTWIATDCQQVHYSNAEIEVPADSIDELDRALDQAVPSAPPRSYGELQSMYDQVLLLILHKITSTKTIMQRTINAVDVLGCRNSSASECAGFPSLDSVPGRTRLDKKAYLGGFDPTELPLFHRQRLLAQAIVREMESIGCGLDLNRLTAAVMSIHASARRQVSQQVTTNEESGPRILQELISYPAPLREVCRRCFPTRIDLDEQFCIGVLWQETNECRVWWHKIRQVVAEQVA